MCLKIFGAPKYNMDQDIYKRERELIYMHKASVRFLRELPGVEEEEILQFGLGA